MKKSRELYKQQTQRVNRAGTQIISPTEKVTGKKIESNTF